jgi:hypothetical protein
MEKSYEKAILLARIVVVKVSESPDPFRFERPKGLRWCMTVDSLEGGATTELFLSSDSCQLGVVWCVVCRRVLRLCISKYVWGLNLFRRFHKMRKTSVSFVMSVRME